MHGLTTSNHWDSKGVQFSIQILYRLYINVHIADDNLLLLNSKVKQQPLPQLQRTSSGTEC